MWCSSCKQDVPAIGHPDTGRSLCPRCNTVLRPPHSMKLCDDGIELDDEPSVSAIREAPPLAADDWQLQRRTREIGRKLRIELGTPRTQSTAALEPHGDVFDQLEHLTASPIVESGSYSQARHINRPRP